MEGKALPQASGHAVPLSRLSAPGFPEDAVRERARRGTAALWPFAEGKGYGATLIGQLPSEPADALDALRLVPPVFMPERLQKLIELGREPYFSDVSLETRIGGFQSSLPVYISALGSTRAAHDDLGIAVAKPSAAFGIPLVIGENVSSVHGYARRVHPERPCFKERAFAYADALPDKGGGLVVQQSTEDANAELWNRVYSDPDFGHLLSSGRLGFELKVGQGAKPGLGGLTLVGPEEAERLRPQFLVEEAFGHDGLRLRSSAPGTFTDEILRQQIRLMRNNYPRALVWVKLSPGRDVALAARVAWQAGADAVVVDGAEAGTGLAPSAFLQGVGLPLLECLLRVRQPAGCLLASGRMWEATRIVKALALGASGAGMGRAALIAANEDPHAGLNRFLESLALELRLVLSALAHYRVSDVRPDDLWDPRSGATASPIFSA